MKFFLTQNVIRIFNLPNSVINIVSDYPSYWLVANNDTPIEDSLSGNMAVQPVFIVRSSILTIFHYEWIWSGYKINVYL